MARSKSKPAGRRVKKSKPKGESAQAQRRDNRVACTLGRIFQYTDGRLGQILD